MSKKPTTTVQRQEIALLAANNRSPTFISKQTGLHLQTIKKELAEPATVELIERAGKLLSEKMLNRADAIIDSITDEDVFKATLRDKTVAAGILMDKSRQAYGLDKPQVLMFGDLSISALFASIQPQPSLLGAVQAEPDHEGAEIEI